MVASVFPPFHQDVQHHCIVPLVEFHLLNEGGPTRRRSLCICASTATPKQLRGLWHAEDGRGNPSRPRSRSPPHTHATNRKRVLQAVCSLFNFSSAPNHRKCLLYSPGDYLKPGEDDISGLKRKMDERLAPPVESKQFDASHGIDNDWEIGDCLAQWWRPNFETFMVRSSFPWDIASWI